MSKKMMRNPIEREKINNPAGNVMEELTEAELDKVTAGIIDYVSHWHSFIPVTQSTTSIL